MQSSGAWNERCAFSFSSGWCTRTYVGIILVLKADAAKQFWAGSTSTACLAFGLSLDRAGRIAWLAGIQLAYLLAATELPFPCSLLSL